MQTDYIKKDIQLLYQCSLEKCFKIHVHQKYLYKHPSIAVCRSIQWHITYEDLGMNIVYVDKNNGRQYARLMVKTLETANRLHHSRAIIILIVLLAYCQAKFIKD